MTEPTSKPSSKRPASKAAPKVSQTKKATKAEVVEDSADDEEDEDKEEDEKEEEEDEEPQESGPGDESNEGEEGDPETQDAVTQLMKLDAGFKPPRGARKKMLPKHQRPKIPAPKKKDIPADGKRPFSKGATVEIKVSPYQWDKATVKEVSKSAPWKYMIKTHDKTLDDRNTKTWRLEGKKVKEIRLSNAFE